jgi:hypothetical protein
VAAPLARRLADRGISVQAAGRLPALDTALVDFAEHALGKRAASRTLTAERLRVASSGAWSGWGLPKDAIARIFSAAASYYRAAPWNFVANEQFLRCQRPNGGLWNDVVLGNGGVEFGLGLHASDENILAQFVAGEAGRAQPTPSSVLSLTFDDGRFLDRAGVREIRSARWEVAGPDAYPFLMALSTPGGGITKSQFDDLEAALLAIPRFVAEYRDELTGEKSAELPITWTDPETGTTVRYAGFAYDSLMGDEVWSAPSVLEPALPSGRNANPRATIADGIARNGGQIDLDALRDSAAREKAIVARFAEYLRSNAGSEPLPAETTTVDSVNAEDFVHFLTEAQGIPARAVIGRASFIRISKPVYSCITLEATREWIGVERPERWDLGNRNWPIRFSARGSSGETKKFCAVRSIPKRAERAESLR